LKDSVNSALGNKPPFPLVVEAMNHKVMVCGEVLQRLSEALKYDFQRRSRGHSFLRSRYSAKYFHRVELLLLWIATAECVEW
jgi:hypothetical protein